MNKNCLCLLLLFIWGGAIAENSNSDLTLSKSELITFAALDTSVDSAKNHSIVATISKGKYKGAKLLGELTHVQNNPKQYQLIFTSMKFNQGSELIMISAYGIDPETARTALKSKINDDYCDRNAKILSTSFLQGKSDAYHAVSHRNRDNSIMSSKIKISSGTNIGVLFVSKISS